MLRKTKIICTIGPATADLESLKKLIECGMDVARLNFSHGTHELHAETIKNIRTASEHLQKPIAIIQDLQGPKIRIGKFQNDQIELKDGDVFTITTDSFIGDEKKVSTSFKNLPSDVESGKILLLDDGYITLQIEKISRNDILTRVIKGGILKNNKGIIAPGSKLSAASLSEKDIDDLRFGLSQGVDFVALSFVQSERDVIELKTTMKLFGRVVPVISKIERYEGFADIEDIIHESDAIMVARGDLGVEMNAEDVPVLQKKIISRCNYYGKAVITATQMLESMIENPRPTRAEASDVANAVLDGTDAVMLSAETSVGKYPFEAVSYMDRIIRKIEENKTKISYNYEVPSGQKENVADAIGHACCVLAEQIHASAIIPLTTSGGTAKIIAKYRPDTPIIALTDNETTLKSLALVWGIYPLLIPPIVDTDSTLSSIHPLVLKTGLVKNGDYVVYTAGIPLQLRTSTNMLKVELL